MTKPILDQTCLIQLERLVQTAHKITLIGHNNPDGDAIGSILGLSKTLSKINPHECDIQMVTPNEGNKNQLYFLDGIEHIINFKQNQERCIAAITEADLIIGLDFNEPSRIDTLETFFLQSKAPKVLIDHHHNPKKECFDIVISKPEMSSTCELIFWTIDQIWGKDIIEKDSAIPLYCGICTDTGTFSYSNSHPSLYEATALLISHNIEPDKLQIMMFNNFSIERMRFYGYAINNRLRIFPEKHFAYFYITKDDQKEFGISKADMEGLVNYTLLMSDIHVGILIREEDCQCRLSFRSKFGIEVHTVAKRLFNGGGHTQAAGATSTLTLDETIALIEKEYLK